MLRRLGDDALAPVLESSEYLRRNPPRKQVLRQGRLAWSDSRDTSLSEIEQLLVDIRRVRNNLFHGGKFPIPDAQIEEVARNERLLKDSLAALNKILGLPGVDQVKLNFAPDDE
jgi:hypothetical protein